MIVVKVRNFMSFSFPVVLVHLLVIRERAPEWLMGGEIFFDRISTL